MTLDMYGEKVASASELIRQVSGKEYFEAFGVSSEGILELFIDCMDKVRQIERETLALPLTEDRLEQFAEEFANGDMGDFDYEGFAKAVMAAAPSQGVAGPVAEAIFKVMKPSNMIDKDWSSGAILGFENGFRDQINAAAKAAIAAYTAPHPAEADKLREALSAWESLRADVLHGPDGLDNDQVNIVLGMIDYHTPQTTSTGAAVAVQAAGQQVPEGWYLVPKTITPAMMKEINLTGTFSDAALQVRYSAMLAAAPIAASMAAVPAKEGE